MSFLANASFWDSNLGAALAGAIVGGLIALVASALGAIWAAHHDRYKRDLEEREKCLQLMSSLLDEIKHLQVSVNSAFEKVSNLIETGVLKRNSY